MSKPIKFFTPVTIPFQKDKIYCHSKILTLGSCFSDHIGNRFANHFFDALVNPFGTVFNPISIVEVLEIAKNKRIIGANDLQSEGNRYFHYDFHSTFDNSDPEKVAERINDAIYKVGDYLQNMDFLVLTLGTSIVYKLMSDNRIVSNCHKVPNNKFQKEFLSIDFMEGKIIGIIDLIKTVNPTFKIILTVSPVRHTKEGLIENSQSKARLIDLCHRLTQNNGAFTYFPAYEIMMDELRDYRYYTSDLIHPSDLAVDIIWLRFLTTYFDRKSIQKVQDMSELNAARNHIPFDQASEEHQEFRRNQLNKIERFNGVYPEVDFREMVEYFRR